MAETDGGSGIGVWDAGIL